MLVVEQHSPASATIGPEIEYDLFEKNVRPLVYILRSAFGVSSDRNQQMQQRIQRICLSFT